MRQLAAVALAIGIAAAAHAAPARPAATTPAPSEIASLERARDAKPNRADRRNALALAYYRWARAAFDRGHPKVYEEYLERAMKEWVAALRLDPENPEPHVYMGIVSAYQGRIDDALDSFYNARALEPGAGHAYTNIAETLIYAGRNAREVETWLSRGERMGANPAIVELNFCLLRWRDGDLQAANRRFNTAMRMDPSVVRVWNEAPVSQPIRTFGDLTTYCCGSPACGPYLENACRASELEVAKRDLPEETALRELRIEMERRRELERIYKERRDLEIRVQKPDAEEPAGSQSSAQRPPAQTTAPAATPAPQSAPAPAPAPNAEPEEGPQ
jgi:tetratricopeptide (TPR) repeat protein